MSSKHVTKNTRGKGESSYYLKRLEETLREKKEADSLRKVIKHRDMPYENSPQGRLLHIMNEELRSRFYSLDCYIQELPPGGRSGKHRHMAEECIFILEGSGVDLHWDAEVEIAERYHWSWAKEPKRLEWEKGDCIYIPPNTIHQHFNSDSSKSALLISANNRIYRHLGYGEIEQLENAPDDQRD